MQIGEWAGPIAQWVIVDLLRYDNFCGMLHIVLPAADYITRNQDDCRFITLR